jgi:hypothetical protein
MILPFKPQFVKPILKGIKIHTIREDQLNRWHAGRSIQMATGVRTKHYNQFNANKPKLQKCISTQQIVIKYHSFHKISGPSVKVDGKSLTALQIHELAVADGFDNIDQFFDWFNTDFTGKIIHWTNKRY